MKTLKYRIIDEESILISEEVSDKNGNIISSIDFQTDPPVEKKYCFNNSNQMTDESELSEGMELCKTSFVYNEKGNCTEQLLYIDGELYEKEISEFNETGYTRTTYQEEIETAKMVKEVNGKNFTNRLYEDGEITEIQKYEFDSANNSGQTEILNEDNEIISIQKETFDNSGFLVKSENYNPSGQLISESISTYEGEYLTREVQHDYRQGGSEIILTYEYDTNKNTTKKEARTFSGLILMFHHKLFDDKNRIIEEKYVSSNSGGIYGVGLTGSNYHFLYEYIDD